MDEQLRPLGDKVIVRRMPAPTESAAGLWLPGESEQGARDRGGLATVVAVGPDAAADVAKDQRVLVGKYGTQFVRFGGEELLVLRGEDVLCVVEE